MTTQSAMAALSVMLIAAGVSAAPAQPSWKHVSTLGQRHFVVIDAAQASDPQLLKQAAQATCPPAKPCVVAFWSDAAAVPAALPMSREQQAAQVAQYLRNPSSGSEELLLKCSAAQSAGAKCLP